MVVFLLFPKVRAGVSFKGRLSSPVCHDEDLADAEEEELHEPGEEVAQPGDGVLLGRVGPPGVQFNRHFRDVPQPVPNYILVLTQV